MGDEEAAGEEEAHEGEGEGGEAWGMEKAKKACGCCCIGYLLFPGMLFLLGYNEKGYVCNQKNIIYAESSATEAECSGTPPDKKFVYFSCELESKDFRTFNLQSFNPSVSADLDQKFSFASMSASQSMEVYQCVETTTIVAEGAGENKTTRTTYNYGMQWASSYVDAGLFKNTTKARASCSGFSGTNRQFPANLVVRAKPLSVDAVKVGIYTLPSDMGKTFTPNTDVSLAEYVNNFSRTLPPISGGTGALPSITATNIRPIQDGSKWYFRTCDSVIAGCTRISFKKNGDKYVSVFGNSGKNEIVEPQPTKASWGCSAGTYEVMYKEKLTKAKAIMKQQSANNGTLYALRVLGILGAWLAVYCCMYPIVAAFDIVSDYLGEVPCVGGFLKMIADIVETLVMIVVCCVSCSFGCSAALFTIAVVWIIMRPVAGAILMAVVVVLGVGACLAMKFAPKKSQQENKVAPVEEES